MKNAIALVGDERDTELIKSLRADKEGASAKRLHAALSKSKLADRIKAMDTIAKNIRSPDTQLAMLLGMCKLLEDENPDVVERAARALREYCRIGKKAATEYHKVFLQRARAAIARGTTKDARKALDAVRRTIPRCEEFPDGPVAAKGAGVGAPPKRKRKPVKVPSEPRWRAVKINGALVSESGAIYALRRHGWDDEDEVVVYRGMPTASSKLELSAVTEAREIFSIVPLHGRWAERAEVAALDADGEVWFIGDGKLEKEHVRGPRPKRGRHKFIGRMTRIRQRGDRLYALGFGGQVYRREWDSAWHAIGSTRPHADGFGVCLYDVDEVSGALIVSGRHFGQGRKAAAIRKANKQGDADALATAILEGRVRDEAALWRHSGDWERLAIGEEAESVFELFQDTEERLHLFLNTGSVLRSLGNKGFERVASFPDLEDIKELGQRVFVLVAGTLLELRDGEETRFDPPLPARVRVDTVSAAGEHMIVASEEAVFQLRDGGWRRLSCYLWSRERDATRDKRRGPLRCARKFCTDPSLRVVVSP